MGPLASPAGLSDPGQRADLFRQVVNHCDPESLRKSVLELMNVMNDPEHADDLPVTSALLRYALDRMEPGEADRLLITEAFMFGQFPGILARLLTDRLITSLGPLTSHFRDRVAAGEDEIASSAKWSHRCWAMAHNPDICADTNCHRRLSSIRAYSALSGVRIWCLRCSRRGCFVCFSCVVDALPGQCLRRRPGAFPLSLPLFRIKWLLRERCSATCQRRRRPGQARHRQGRPQITAVMRGVRGWRLLRAFTFCSGPSQDGSMQFVGLPGGGTKLG